MGTVEDYNNQRSEYYDRRAPEYDDAYRGAGLWAELRRSGSEEELRRLVRAISDLPLGRVLDVACGTGFLTRHLSGEVTGLDSSEEMLKIAQERVPEASFIRGDAFSLPFPDASFDRVFTSNFYGLLLPHERSAFLGEVRRVAPELVVAETTPLVVVAPEGWQERILSDGSHHRIYRRYFSAEDLAEELGGGRILFAGALFVMVAA
jgi:ubiquinone/menaquinone biosynthesis C-methylase UbiE